MWQGKVGKDAAVRPLRGVPRHVALIMDGSNLWAATKGLPSVEGQRRGFDAVGRIVRAAIKFGVSYLTIYPFSQRNSLGPDEVESIFDVFRLFINSQLCELQTRNVRVRVLGGVTPDIAELCREAEQVTHANTGLTLIVALDHGARQTIVAAVRKLAEAVVEGRISADEIDSDSVAAQLDTASVPDPDLIIRTSGEQRLSNLLLWQAAYAEFLFLPILWPDFDEAAFAAALVEYTRRDRRFGRIT